MTMSISSTKLQCSHCLGGAELLFRTEDHNRKTSHRKFDYYRCVNCGYIFLSPLPRDLADYYPKHYYAIPSSEQELASTAKKYQQWKLDLVLRFKSTGRLLEIGPAYGLFSYLAKQAGFDMTAIEMDSRCCDFLRGTLGIEVVQGADTLRCLKTMPKFDVIVMWQVIEHMEDPWAVLTGVAEHLAPNGILVLDTPNPQSLQFRILGGYWTHVDAPRHLTLLRAPLVVEHLERQGLLSLHLTSADKGAIGYNGFGWAFSLKNFFSGRVAGAIAYLSGRLLAKILIPVERTGWRGSTYTAVFKRPASI